MSLKRKNRRKAVSLVNQLTAAVVCYLLLGAFPFAVAGQAKLRAGGRAAGKAEPKRNSPYRAKALNLGRLPAQVKLRAAAGDTPGETFRGEPGITETVAEIMAREQSLAKEPFDPRVVIERKKEIEYKPRKKPAPNAPAIPRFPFDPNENLTAADGLLPQAIGTSIAGPGRNADGIGAVPPDSVGDVGPTQVLMHANGRIKVYDKFTGAVGVLDALDTTFWNSVRNGAGISDPRVEYDRLTGRWFLCMINITSTQNRLMIAVSSGPVITNASSFTFFQITTASAFLDYPTLGVDANALYIGGNVFTSSTGSFESTRGYVVNKADLLSGTLTATVFNNLVSGGTAGPWTPQGVSNDDASFTEGYFIGVDNLSFGLLQLRRVANPAGAPTISDNIGVTVPATTFPANQEHQGRDATGFSRLLDALDDRLFQAQITRDNVTGASTLWTAHNIRVSASGVASTAAGNRNGSRWYQLGNLTGTPTLLQAGTLFDSAATNPNGYWIPSTAMSGQGHMAIGANSAGVNRFAELWAAGRLRSDALGTTQAPTQAQASSFAYNLESASTQRWGDYSKTVVDPCDNQSIWHIGEYTDAANSWRMRAFKLVAPGPPAAVTPSPANVSRGVSNINVVVSGVSAGGTEFYDNPAGFVCSPSCNTTGTGNCRLTATVTASPLVAPLTINSVTFNSPTQVTLNLSAAGATAGTHTIQLRNPDGQATNFNLQVLEPTAATVPLGGLIRTSSGAPLAGAAVTVLDTFSGESMTLTSDAGGRYVQPLAAVGRNYVVTPARAGFTFEPGSRVVSLNEENLGVDFVAAATAPSGAAFNDFDGDGQTDLAVYRASDQNWYIRESRTQSMKVENWGLATDVLTPADFDGDGKTDVAVWRPANGTWYVRRSADGGVATIAFGQEEDVPAAGDYDGDGKADAAVFRPKDGTWLIRQSTDGATRTVRWGTRGDRPVPRDFDGDGRVDPTVFRPADGRWYALYSSNAGQAIVPFGLATDRVAPADYDGDGRTDIAVYRPNAGAWFVLQSTNSSASIQIFGLESDQTVAGDYNGDGRADLAIYRPSDSTWYVRRSDGNFDAVKWGTAGDVPAVPAYLK